ncbi:hypothetical protein COCNU_02G019630 [Cocos nucifera]|uniref:DUF599 domain-containing protein n=1 Tax=Cocos nucifera TaxID=13894 RepID=A0A8K0I0T8_COCNU|nr:hypothetical protein COCNU_02G019630 [Cocos nucifera]
MGVTARGPRVWIMAMLKDSDRKNVLVVQTLRNHILGSTLIATSSVLICCGLLTFAGNTYNAPKRHRNELEVTSKCAAMILAMLCALSCQILSIMFVNQVNMLANTLTVEDCPVTPEFAAKLLAKGVFLNTVGNRLFFCGLPLLLWVFGPVLVLLSSVALIPVWYSIDFVGADDKGEVGAKVSAGMGHGEFNAAGA